MSEASTIDHDRISRAWRALVMYRALSLQVLDAKAASFENLPEPDQKLVEELPQRLSHLALGVEQNADLFERVASLADMPGLEYSADDHIADAAEDLPHLVEALGLLSMDWTAAGVAFRDCVYTPILDAVDEAAEDALAAGEIAARGQFRILVPGAALGRLAWETACRGYAVEGVESSYILLFICNFILNVSSSVTKPLVCQPYVHQLENVASDEDQTREHKLPDIDPSILGLNSNFSMCAGEFLELYDEAESWDCVVTCFFLESAHNIVSYIRRIAKILKTGGVWINHGTLDYKYAEAQDEPSIEITAEELYNVIPRIGLRLLCKENRKCGRAKGPHGLYLEEYDTLFFTAVRL